MRWVYSGIVALLIALLVLLALAEPRIRHRRRFSALRARRRLDDRHHRDLRTRHADRQRPDVADQAIPGGARGPSARHGSLDVQIGSPVARLISFSTRLVRTVAMPGKSKQKPFQKQVARRRDRRTSRADDSPPRRWWRNIQAPRAARPPSRMNVSTWPSMCRVSVTCTTAWKESRCRRIDTGGISLQDPRIFEYRTRRQQAEADMPDPIGPDPDWRSGRPPGGRGVSCGPVLR